MTKADVKLATKGNIQGTKCSTREFDYFYTLTARPRIWRKINFANNQSRSNISL